MTRKLIAFGWYGGKYSHLDWLLGLLPEAHHYCEPFGGSAAVLLNRDPSPVETYNDIDGEVVNFFRVLREQKDELIYAIGMTPFAREEFLDSDPNEWKRARVDLVGAGPALLRACPAGANWPGADSIRRTLGELPSDQPGRHGRRRLALVGSVEGLEWIATRLLRVQIENDVAANVIQRYDSPNTLFYCDPPYPHDSRGDSKAYQYEMTDAEHVRSSWGAGAGRGESGDLRLPL